MDAAVAWPCRLWIPRGSELSHGVMGRHETLVRNAVAAFRVLLWYQFSRAIICRVEGASEQMSMAESMVDHDDEQVASFLERLQASAPEATKNVPNGKRETYVAFLASLCVLRVCADTGNRRQATISESARCAYGRARRRCQ